MLLQLSPGIQNYSFAVVRSLHGVRGLLAEAFTWLSRTTGTSDTLSLPKQIARSTHHRTLDMWLATNSSNSDLFTSLSNVFTPA